MKLFHVIFNLLTCTISSLVITLAFYAELGYLNYSFDSSFFINVFSLTFLVIFILHRLVYSAYDKKVRENEAVKSKPRWNPVALGPFRSFEPIVLKTPSERYKHEVDLGFLAVSVSVFFFVHLFLYLISQQKVIAEGIINRDAFIYAFAVFFSYSLILIASLVISYEAYIVEKKGKDRVSSGSMYAYIFFIFILSIILFKYAFDAASLLFF